MEVRVTGPLAREIEVHEFMNECHGEDGRFCETHGGVHSGAEAVLQGPSPLDYSESSYVQPDRLAIVEPDAGPARKGEFGFAELRSQTYTSPTTGRRLKKPREVVTPGAAEGTVAFVDYSIDRGMLKINYMKTRSDRQGQGLATKLLVQLIEAHPGQSVDFGKLMNKTSARLMEKMKERFPDRRFYSKIYY